MTKRIVLMLALVLALAGCANELGDRSGTAGGRKADEVRDVTNVRVYRNIDAFPNVALFCVDGMAFWSSSRGTQQGMSMDRLPERDGECRG